MYQLTAAHRSLPIPCFARVTNLENGKSTVVRINDRGPFHSERIIDLSFALMSIPNMLAILYLSRRVKDEMRARQWLP